MAQEKSIKMFRLEKIGLPLPPKDCSKSPFPCDQAELGSLNDGKSA